MILNRTTFHKGSTSIKNKSKADKKSTDINDYAIIHDVGKPMYHLTKSYWNGFSEEDRWIKMLYGNQIKKEP